jgi:hypothetical protein
MLMYHHANQMRATLITFENCSMVLQAGAASLCSWMLCIPVSLHTMVLFRIQVHRPAE